MSETTVYGNYLSKRPSEEETVKVADMKETPKKCGLALTQTVFSAAKTTYFSGKIRSSSLLQRRRAQDSTAWVHHHHDWPAAACPHAAPWPRSHCTNAAEWSLTAMAVNTAALHGAQNWTRDNLHVSSTQIKHPNEECLVVCSQTHTGVMTPGT